MTAAPVPLGSTNGGGSFSFANAKTGKLSPLVHFKPFAERDAYLPNTTNIFQSIPLASNELYEGLSFEVRTAHRIKSLY